MPTKHCMRSMQRGSSVVAFPVITFVMVLLILFIVKINQGINQKNQLNNVAYSLTSIVACGECDNTINALGSHTGMPKVSVITIELADSLLHIAERYFNDLVTESSAEIGLHLEQIIFSPSTQKPKLYDFNAGVECVSIKPLLSLTDLSPLGTTAGLNAGLHAELFQVTLCIKGIENFAGGITPLFIRGFSDRYYQSSALLIGRDI